MDHATFLVSGIAGCLRTADEKFFLRHDEPARIPGAAGDLL